MAPVLISHDVFSYLDYARLGVVHGIDPYVRGPHAAAADPVFARVTWPHTTSAYGPLFTLATYPLAWLPVGIAIAVLKAVAALSVLGLALLCGRIAAWRGIEPLRAAALVALNPLVLVHVVGGAHNDGLMMLLAMLGVAAILSAREASGGAALIAAAATKAAALFLAPFPLLAAARPSTGRFPASATRWKLSWTSRVSASMALRRFSLYWGHRGETGIGSLTMIRAVLRKGLIRPPTFPPFSRFTISHRFVMNSTNLSKSESGRR